MIQFAFDYDKRKTIQALRFHFIARREIKLLVILINVFAILSAILYYTKKIRPEFLLLGSILWLMIMIAVWFVLPYTVYKKTELFKHQFIAFINNDKLIFEAEHGSATWPWDKFEIFFETPNFFHLYFNSKSFILLPKNEVGDAELHEIRAILNEKITKK